MYFIATKDKVFSRFKDFLTASPHHLQVHTLQSDNSSKYTGSDFQEYLKHHGIEHQPTPPYTPEYNGVTKQFNRTIISMAHSMLADSSLPHSFWSEAITTAIYINNHAPTKANQGQSPLELWMGITPYLSHLHTFSSPVYLHINHSTHKLNNQVKDALYLSPTSDPSQHQLWVPSSQTITISHNMHFMEESGKANTHASLPPIQVHTTTPPTTAAGALDDTLVEGSNTTLNLNTSHGGNSPVNSPTMLTIQYKRLSQVLLSQITLVVYCDADTP